jgi:hypothetical protein
MLGACLAALCVMDISALPSLPPIATDDWLTGSESAHSGLFQGPNAGIVLANGLVSRTFATGTHNLATTSLRHRVTGEEFVRAIRPECSLRVDGEEINVGGLIGQPVGNYVLPKWLNSLESDPAALAYQGYRSGSIRIPFAWKPRKEWLSREANWPPKGLELVLHFSGRGLDVDVHYEIYDGLPLFAKWFEVTNGRDTTVTLDSFKSEILATVESDSEVEKDVAPKLPKIHVESEFTSVSMTGESSQRDTVKWKPDPTYTSQVNYRLETPCLLEVAPPLGPARKMKPGETFTSFRTFELIHDSRDDTRQALALSRMYRTIAPWGQENPLIFHVRNADPKSLREAVDQAKAVGFELIIMTFGSGFDIENASPEYLAEMKSAADYAHQNGIAIGGYSLLASRSIDAENDVVNPATGKPGGFATFDNSPCIGSKWGADYFAKLYAFFEATGMDVLEHDGSYPGDACASTTHPGHTGYDDSRYTQWQTVTAFYQWCRGRGVYLNVPDWYFLSGANKTGMGYRETNWSLPRAQQEIIERQNIHDGTRFKAPTMGWMFVPLTEYHGGGPEATIEPLKDHIDHYERRLKNLLGAGVQACYRGPRLYDSPEVEAMVKRNVDWFKAHRTILESDLVPLRRADGRDWDGWVHVNPFAEERALAMIYNPLPTEIEREIRVPLNYAGLQDEARVSADGGPFRLVKLSRDGSALVKVKVTAQGSTALIFRR